MILRALLAATLALLVPGSLLLACSDDDQSASNDEGTSGKGGKGGKGGSGGASGKGGGGGSSGSGGSGAAGQGGKAGSSGSSSCLPSCAGRFCGAPDGCGSKCTDCPSTNQICDAKSFTCVSTGGCQPSCTGKNCGQDDGCGGKCKVCPQPGNVCDEASGTCKPPGGCQPSCAGKVCGQDDGCQGKCTTCPGGQSCNVATGQCTTAVCQPSCDGKQCGQDDGCGTKCSNCADPDAVCNPNTGACVVPCKPSCAGKQCGDPNGCGGKCGGCPAGELCDTDTWSCKPPCKPSCDGKACGDDDGCGGKCSSCQAGQFCSPKTFACEPCTISCQNGCLLFQGNVQVCRCGNGQQAKFDGTCVDDPNCATGCGDHGTCVGQPTPIGVLYSCACEPGYIDGGGRCTPERRFYCRDKDGSLQEMGTTRCSADDSQFEVCRDVDGDGLQEWAASGSPSCPLGTTCSACKDWGCKDGVPCPEGTLCVTKIHEQDSYACFGGTCDCSNCGTCNNGDFKGQQAFCGNDGNNNPTLACKQPCPPGLGCIPFTVDGGGQHYPGICYPLEGCFSAAPN